MKSRKIKLTIITIVGLISAFFLLHIQSSGLISTKQVIKEWNNHYFTNTTKLLFVGFIFTSIVISISSSSIQNLNRNNIATGSTLGIGATGTFGYIISHYFQIYNYYFVLSIMLISASIPVILNFFLIKGKNAGNNVILLGLAMTSIVGVINYILRDQMGMLNSKLIFLGSFHGTTTWRKFWYALPLGIVGFILVAINFNKLTLVSYSYELAQKHNVNLNILYLQVAIGNILLIVSAIFLIGEITFLGIIGTNIVRRLLKTSNTAILTFASLSLNIFVLFIAQIFYVYYEINVILTVVIVAIPIFLWTIMRKGNNA